uniref:Uncharacterized protein n=1 Tax=Arundo donax TaxID=35708 RepID=A0A0A9C3H5_ARUDO
MFVFYNSDMDLRAYNLLSRIELG